MSGSDNRVLTITQDLQPHGLRPRGVAVFGDSRAGPRLGDGRAARAVLLVGHAGGSLWPAFSAWRCTQTDDGGSDPLDNWSKAILRPIADKTGATAFFPSDQPYQPFQQWALRAEGLKASPLGILIHPQYGLWHGYRAALAFAEWTEGEGPGDEGAPQVHPCDTCAEKPCLTHCPVDAVLPGRFDVGACHGYLQGEAGEAGCIQHGCIARSACPVGAGYAYGQDQARFHMRALMRRF